MSHERKTDDETRDSIMQLLSDEEVARVSAAEGEAGLTEGEEYIDLAAPDNGVRRVHGELQRTVGQVLPRSAVSADTWAKIGTRFGTRFAKAPAK